MSATGATHPLLASLRGGMGADEAGWHRASVEAAEGAMAGARAAAGNPAVAEPIVTELLREARRRVDKAARVALDACSTHDPVRKWREANVRELEQLARTRLGRLPEWIGLDYEPLR